MGRHETTLQALVFQATLAHHLLRYGNRQRMSLHGLKSVWYPQNHQSFCKDALAQSWANHDVSLKEPNTARTDARVQLKRI